MLTVLKRYFYSCSFSSLRLFIVLICVGETGFVKGLHRIGMLHCYEINLCRITVELVMSTRLCFL